MLWDQKTVMQVQSMHAMPQPSARCVAVCIIVRQFCSAWLQVSHVGEDVCRKGGCSAHKEYTCYQLKIA